MPPERSEKPDSLEARLRRLPPPAVPADLESRLIEAISAQQSIEHPLQLSAKPQAMSGWRRQWAWWAGAAAALAAACLLIVLFWPKGNHQKPDQKDNGFANNGSSNTVRPQSPAEAIAPWSQARASDEPKLPPFTWPVDETTHVTLANLIPSDLLD